MNLLNHLFVILIYNSLMYMTKVLVKVIFKTEISLSTVVMWDWGTEEHRFKTLTRPAISKKNN